MTKKIRLTKGKFTTVDDEDYEFLSEFNWCITRSGKKEYAITRMGIKNGYDGKNVTMHRIILNPPKGMCVDHIDGDGLNNRRSNLRICTQAENVRNRRKPSINDEKYIGIKTYKGVRKTRYKAVIGHNGKVKHIGMFDTAEEAARAYDAEAVKLFKEFACTNF